MSQIIDVAIACAEEAGEYLLSQFGRIDHIEPKADSTLVTNVDRRSEELIVERIAATFPHHRIWGEESGGAVDPDGYTWIVDPLDGTHNFVRGIAMYGVSIGIVHGNEFVAGVISLPASKELYAAEKGAGALKNGEKISVSRCESLALSTLLYDSGVRNRPEVKLALLERLALRVFNVRMLGCSVRNLSYVAEGAADFVVEFDDHPWDFAGGAAIVLEAGGTLSTHRGAPLIADNVDYVISNGLLHSAVLEVIAQ